MDARFKIINLHIKENSHPKRLRDLSLIFSAHEESMEEDTAIFMAGGFNFNLDLTTPLPDALTWREYDEWNRLKKTRKYPQTREQVD